jgi:hypothetical protein
MRGDAEIHGLGIENQTPKDDDRPETHMTDQRIIPLRVAQFAFRIHFESVHRMGANPRMIVFQHNRRLSPV